MSIERQEARDLALLEHLERDPDMTQAGLADQLGVAVGTVNWHIKRLVAKGYVKVKRMERRKLRYIITPEGLALRARLTVDYVEQSMALFRSTRTAARRALRKARDLGYERVTIEGNGDIADVCRLTCLEQGVQIVQEASNEKVGVLKINGHKIQFVEPGKST